MGLVKGSVSISRFQVLGLVPSGEEVIEGLQGKPFRPFHDGVEEERSGVCDALNHLKGGPKNDAPTFMDGKVLFGLRIDTRKVPASELNAHLDLRLETLMKEKDLVFVGKEARTSLRDEVKAELLGKVRPSTKVTEALWNLRGGSLLVAGGNKPITMGRALLTELFGSETRALTPVNLASMLLPTSTEASLLHGQSREIIEPLMGQLFLAWLWKRAQEDGGTANNEDSTSLLFGDSLKLVTDAGTIKEAALKKGEPIESHAALEALAEGMLPASAKVRVLSGDLEWFFTLDHNLKISGLKLPKTAGNDLVSRIADRLFLVDEVLGHLDLRFKEFLGTWEAGPDQLQEDAKAWGRQLVAAGV